ncbi:MAG TPA: methionyl-tRNA formyltransferase [Thermoanaerobaculia bacterium]|nr:methionyl-tRNA formyltransferase [Thermoanaerobaculia bacterium]
MSESIDLFPLVVFGTPSFSVPTLDALDAAGRTPVAVISQPPRQAGRGRARSQPPVAEWALDRNVALLQPERVRDESFLAELAHFGPTLAVVVAFGQIFPQALLDLPAQGCMNLHASLLPAYRGASPISAAIAAGETVTGVTTMLMERGLDSGPVLLQREVPIEPEDTTDRLGARLARAGGALVVETIERWERGEIEPREQDRSAATFAPRLSKGDGEIDWRRPAVEIERWVRAMTPWPGAVTSFRGTPLRVLETSMGPADRSGRDPGRLLGTVGESVVVACGAGNLALDRVQRAGRRPVSGRDFWNGEQPHPGERLGSEASA